MRYLMKRGQKIKLLSAALPEEEDIICGKCGSNFDSTECRRACFYICGHVACLSCIFKMGSGCEDCASEQSICSTVLQIPVAITVNHEDKTDKIPRVSLISSRLTTSSEKDENAFPEIKNMCTSKIPILKHANEPPTFAIDEEEEDEWEAQFVREMELQKQPDCQQESRNEDDIPIIDLSVEDYIPVIDLSDDEQFQATYSTDHTILTTRQASDNCQIISEQDVTLPVDKIYHPSILDTPPATPEDQNDNEQTCDNLNNAPAITDEIENTPRPLRNRRKSQCFSNNTGNFIGFGKYLCRYCNVNGFIDKAALGRHLYQEHWNIRPFPCKICDWPFNSQRNLDHHMLTHSNERSFRCNPCDMEFNTKYTLDKHLQNVHGVVRKKRGRRARKDKRLRLTNNNHDKSYQNFEACFEREEAPIPIPIPIHFHDEIDEDYPTVMNYSEPSSEMTDNLILADIRPYSCGMCDATFYLIFRLERHMETAHGIRIRLTPEETSVGDEYCPECQSLFGTLDCQKVAYSECGHISCMECVIRAELGCGQCTTEMAPKSWSVEEMEIADQ